MRFNKVTKQEATHVSWNWSDRAQRTPRYAAEKVPTYYAVDDNGEYEGTDLGDGRISVTVNPGYQDWLFSL